MIQRKGTTVSISLARFPPVANARREQGGDRISLVESAHPRPQPPPPDGGVIATIDEQATNAQAYPPR
jgi:hypothetical protein